VQRPARLCACCAPLQGVERQPDLRAPHSAVDLLLGVRAASCTPAQRVKLFKPEGSIFFGARRSDGVTV
jgi:hypothetical protein